MRLVENPEEKIKKMEYLANFDKTTFHLIELLAIVLGTGNYYVTNGASLYYRLATHGLERIPTDLDLVTPEFDLPQIQNELRMQGVSSIYDSHPVSKWGLRYCEPQLRGNLNGITFDIVAKSTILKSDGKKLEQHQFSSSPDWVDHHGILIPVAKLATVKEAKKFQERPHPKQDLSDLEHIEFLLKGKRG